MTNKGDLEMDQKDKIERAIWEVVNLMGENSQVKPEQKIWKYLLCFVPDEEIAKEFDLRKSMKAIEEAFSDPSIWCEQCQHEMAGESGLCQTCEAKDDDLHWLWREYGDLT
jgi:Zn finger protein HypA/HybF involved in hydrogenase expression